MLLEHLKNYRIGHVIVLPLAGIALWANTFLNNVQGVQVEYGTFHMPFYSSFIKLFHDPALSVYASAIALFIIILQAFQVSYLANRYQLFKTRTFLPGYIYLLLVSLYVGLQKLHPALIANFFILFALDHIFASINKNKTLNNTFYAAILIAVGSLFYLKSFVFIFVAWFALIFLKRSSFREFLVSVFGAALPPFLFWAYYFIKYGSAKELKVTVSLVGFIKETYYPIDWIYYIAFGFIGFMALIAIFRMLAGLRFRINTTRNQLMVLFLMLIISIVTYFTGPFSLEMITFAAVPLAIIISDYFLSVKEGWIPESLLYIMIALFIFLQIVK